MNAGNDPQQFDRNFIALEDRHEVNYWMMTFGCTREQLIEAVRKVGNTAPRVGKELGQPGDE